MKFAIIGWIATMAGVSATYDPDFPQVDAFHAHCKISTIFHEDCQTVFNVFKEKMQNIQDGSISDLASLTSSIKIFEEDWINRFIWITRTSGEGKGKRR